MTTDDDDDDDDDDVGLNVLGCLADILGTSSDHCTQGPRYRSLTAPSQLVIVQELRESRGGRPGLSVLTSLLVSVDVKIY